MHTNAVLIKTLVLCKFNEMIGEGKNKEPMIAITGALGFIGSCVATKLGRSNEFKLVMVDDFSATEKNSNIDNIAFAQKIDRKDFIHWLKGEEALKIEYIIHIGARTDTAEFRTEIFNELNLNYSKEIWNFCTEKNIPLIYASSAATYGDGENGYVDDHRLIEKLKPLNPYGDSKNDFDKWVLGQKKSPGFWYGLKFFNVYGPNEFHKGRMASVIFHAFNQLKETGKVKLFRSHKTEFTDGKQLRDFIYVNDVVKVIVWLLGLKTFSGIYNLGTGTARTFYDLAKATAAAMDIPLQIEWIDIPEDIRDKYQYFTEAKMDKLISAGYDETFFSLEKGINDYVKNYLLTGKYS